jgi:hypothetical protein
MISFHLYIYRTNTLAIFFWAPRIYKMLLRVHICYVNKSLKAKQKSTMKKKKNEKRKKSNPSLHLCGGGLWGSTPPHDLSSPVFGWFARDSPTLVTTMKVGRPPMITFVDNGVGDFATQPPHAGVVRGGTTPPPWGWLATRGPHPRATSLRMGVGH